MEKFNPGICEVQKARIAPYGVSPDDESAQDITALIASFTIQQSLDSTAIRGNMFILDNLGFIERLPLRGEEELFLEIKSFDLGTTRTLRARIYKISDVQRTESGNGSTYRLHFISKLSYDANLNYLITSFNGVTGDKAIEEIFKKNYSKITETQETTNNGKTIEQPNKTRVYQISKEKNRLFFIQPTYGNMQLTIPRYAPAEAITFVANRSFSQDQYLSSTYRFFETWDGFFYVTDEWLNDKARMAKKIETLNYFTFSTRDPEGAAQQISTIQDFRNSRRADVAQEMLSGAYTSAFLEVDLLRHKVNRYDYSYLQSEEDFIKANPNSISLSKKIKAKQEFVSSGAGPASLANDIHSQGFINDTFTAENAKRHMIIRDYTSKETGSGLSKDDTFYRQSTAYKTFYSNHMNATSVMMSIKGRLDLVPGDVVNINIRDMDAAGEAKANKQLSGPYLIRTVINNVEGNVLNTVCTIVKYDWSGAGLDTSEVG